MNTHAHLPSPRALKGIAAAAVLAAAMTAPVHAVPLVGLTTSHQLARFDSASPGMATMVSISGMEAGERLVGIDLRPSNNTIYGISASNRIYTVDEPTGAASFVTALSAPVVDPALGWGLDFNPVADSLPAPHRCAWSARPAATLPST